MSRPIPPMIWATQVTAKLLGLFGLLSIFGCAMVIGHGNAVDESDVSKTYETLPELVASDQEALIVVVHEYYKRCCGASADVQLKGQSDNSDTKSGRLAAVDDFICWRIAPGVFQWVPNIDDQSFSPVSIDAQGGQTYYFRVSSDLRNSSSYEVEVDIISERLAYHYIYATLKRVRDYRTTGASPEVIERIKSNGPKRVAEKLKCS